MHIGDSSSTSSFTHSHLQNRSQRQLWMALTVSLFILCIEAVGGYLAQSLALLADAGHMLTDILALLVAIAAATLGRKPADVRRTYGYRRLEVLAALINSVALVAIAGSIIYEAVMRWLHPQPIDVTIMLISSTLGLLANAWGLWILRANHHDLNLRSAFLHMWGDMLSVAGVLLGSLLIALTGWLKLDPILSIFISIIIALGSFRLLKEVIDVLLEAAPRGIRTEAVRESLEQIAGVKEVHDLHIWSITSGMPALSAHLVVTDPLAHPRALLQSVHNHLRTAYSIEHATLQLEGEPFEECGCRSKPCPKPGTSSSP